MAFHAMGLAAWLCRQLDNLGMRAPTPVQAAVIPALLQGKQLCISACTGSGKTAAYLLPILHLLTADPYGVYAIIIAPSRELALQVSHTIKILGGPANVWHALIVGGDARGQQPVSVRNRPHLVVGTPGRIRDVLEGPDSENAFKKLRFLVIDEADKLLCEEPDAAADVMAICEALPGNRRTLFVSATVTAALRRTVRKLMSQPIEFVAVDGKNSLPPALEERLLWTPPALLYANLYHLLDPSVMPARSVLIFTSNRQKEELVRLTLEELGVAVTGISAMQPQRERYRHLKAFRGGNVRVLVATDLVSRGLDLPAVDLVINFDIPEKVGIYIHRVGRTARAGRSGTAVTFVQPGPVDLKKVDYIARVTKHQFEELKVSQDDVVQHLSMVTKARLRAEKRYEQLYAAEAAEARRMAESQAARRREADGLPEEDAPPAKKRRKRAPSKKQKRGSKKRAAW